MIDLIYLSKNHQYSLKNYEKFEILIKQIKMLKNEVEKHSDFIVVYLPGFFEIKNKNSYFSESMSKKLNDLQIKNISLYDKFIEESIEDIFYYGLPDHYSESGYEILAETISNNLKNL